MSAETTSRALRCTGLRCATADVCDAKPDLCERPITCSDPTVSAALSHALSALAAAAMEGLGRSWLANNFVERTIAHFKLHPHSLLAHQQVDIPTAAALSSLECTHTKPKNIRVRTAHCGCLRTLADSDRPRPTLAPHTLLLRAHRQPPVAFVALAAQRGAALDRSHAASC